MDGYNLLFRQEKEGKNLETKRNLLISSIVVNFNRLKLKGTLVFDAPHQSEAATRSHVGTISVVYTSCQETADEWILNHIRECQDPHQLMVVTSDRDLAFQARQLRAKTISTTAFLSTLDKQLERRKASLSPLSPPSSSLIAKMPGDPLNQEEIRYLKQFEANAEPIETDFGRWLRLFEGRGKQ